MKSWLVGFHLVVVCVGSGENTGYSQVVGIIGKQAVLPCIYNTTKEMTAADLMVSWQMDVNQVVHAQYGEREQNEHQNVRYRNRTSFLAGKLSEGDLSLVLSGMRFDDQGEYECIVILRVGAAYRKRQATKTTLVAAAHYSTPVISGPKEEDIRPGGAVTLTCRSTGGYPEPIVNWTDGGGNYIPGNSTVETSSEQDPVSCLWNVTSVLRVTVTNNSTFVCSVFNSRTQETRTPAIWKCFSEEFTGSQHDDKAAVILAGIASAIILAFAVTMGLKFYIRWRKKRTEYIVTSSHEIDRSLDPTIPTLYEADAVCLE